MSRLYKQYGQARDVMLSATQTRHAPWALVDFNDRRRGRLALIHQLLSRPPDVTVPQPKLKFGPLGHKPLLEHFGRKHRPIK